MTKVLLTVSPFRPFLLTQFRVSPCTPRRSPLCDLCASVANPIFSAICRLLSVPKKVNSFAIKQIQPLLPKHPGWGYPRKNHPMESATYSLFSPDLFMIWLTPCFVGSVSRCLCGNRNFSATFSRHSFTPILEGSLSFCDLCARSVLALWRVF